MTLTKLKQRAGSTLRMFSLVLCILFSLLWVRSCSTSDLVTLSTVNHYFELATIPASLRFAVAGRMWAPQPLTWTASDIMPKPGVPQPVFAQRPISRAWYYFGVGVKRDAWSFRSSGGRRVVPTTIISIPIQLLAFIFFLPTAWRIATIGHRRRLRQSRIDQSQCPTCGYDLRATPERCPECGTSISIPAT